MSKSKFFSLALLVTLLFVVSQKVIGQTNESFVNTYDYYMIKDKLEDEWSEAREYRNTFIFNYNTNGDVKHFRTNGDPEIYVRISKFEDGKTTNGITYQFFDVVDANGLEMVFTLYSDGTLMIIFKTDPPGSAIMYNK